MSHPKNRRERFLIGKHKGKVRGYGYWESFKHIPPEAREEHIRVASYRRRDTTKLCSCSMCGNPRRVAWKDKLTMQEKKFNEGEKMILFELVEPVPMLGKKESKDFILYMKSLGASFSDKLEEKIKQWKKELEAH